MSSTFQVSGHRWEPIPAGVVVPSRHSSEATLTCAAYGCATIPGMWLVATERPPERRFDRTLGNSWSVTHASSGRAAGFWKGERVAAKMAAQLDELLDFSLPLIAFNRLRRQDPMLDKRCSAILSGEPDPLLEYWQAEGLIDEDHVELPSGPLGRGDLVAALRELKDATVEVRCGAYRVERQRTATETTERKAAVKAILNLVKLAPHDATFVAELARQSSAAPPWRVTATWPGGQYCLRLPYAFTLVETSTSTAQACA